MSIHVALNHVTHYRYDRPIMLGPVEFIDRPGWRVQVGVSYDFDSLFGK
jgi:hypothetical protein